MAKIQIKSETRHELSFFPNSFDDYVPKDSKVRMVDRIVRSMDINPLMDKYRKRHGKQSKCVTADSGYGSEENYEYMEMEEMVGYVKTTGFTKNSINLSRKMSLTKQISTIIKTKTITSVPWDNYALL